MVHVMPSPLTQNILATGDVMPLPSMLPYNTMPFPAIISYCDQGMQGYILNHSGTVIEATSSVGDCPFLGYIFAKGEVWPFHVRHSAL